MAKFNYSEMSVIDIYHAFLSGEIKCFPNGVWCQDTARELLRYVIIKQDLGIKNSILSEKDKEKVKPYICSLGWRNYLRSKRLMTAPKMFDVNIFSMVSYCFNDLNIYPWEIKKAGDGFWKISENRLMALKYYAKLQEVDLDNIEQVRTLSARKISEYFGNKLLHYSNGSFFELLDLYYKGKYKEWEVVTKVGKWTENKAIEATKWLIEEKCGWNTKEQVCENISVEVFKKHGLESMLNHACRHSPLIALQIAYPEKKYTAEDIKTYI